ncbi:MAG TPA: zinc-ribbon domain-containing protein, partial [Pyrinomonadaceae bacterium]|nr:zinc-ribbon domain-containing protein [Pyrinomonadaceae bacterium]
MYCPKCGTESSSDQRFCRSCGSNLKVIGKAVALGEVIARSDRGPMLKIKELVESAKIKKTTDDVSHALDKMGQDISQSPAGKEHPEPWWMKFKDQRTPERRREDHLVKGTISLFSGIGLMVFLYYLAASIVLKIPPETLAKLPFELEPVMKMIWMVGLIPALSGIGRIIAGLMIKSSPPPRSLENEEPLETMKEVADSRPTTAGNFLH